MDYEPDYSDEVTDRQMPHNLEAEAGVLGSLLLYPERVDLIRGVVDPADFYSKPYGLILSALLDMSDQNQPIDPLTLREELTRRDQLDMAGGAAGLSELTAAVPNSANLEHYAKIVRGKAIYRSIIAAGTEILEEGYTGQRTAEDLLDFCEHRMFQVGERSGVLETSSLKDVLKKAWDELEKLHQREREGTTGGVPSQYHQLDQMLGGFHGGELIIVAARPSMGKSTFTLN
ncbi:MAG: DnaB-like helicase N-terminal domain-containing protein, partial [Planctomycetota bacterium]